MNNSIKNFTVTLVLIGVTSFVLPWWFIMIVGFITAILFPLRKASVFFVPFLAVFLFWLTYTFFKSSANDFILAKKIAVLLFLDGNAIALMLITSIIGGVATGIAAIFGKQTLLLFKN